MTQEQLHNTYMTYLMVSEDGTTWKKLCDIKEYPDLGSAPKTLDATTLSDPMHVYIEDIQDPGGVMEFPTNYRWSEFEELAQYKGKLLYWAVWLGGELNTSGEMEPKGQFGKFEWQGTLATWKKGGSVGGVQETGIGIVPNTPIEPNFAKASE